MSRFWIVFTKELLDNIRDRRTVAMALFFGPVFGPVLFLLIMRMSVDVIKEESDKPLELPVVGQAHAPNLIRFLEDNGVVIKPPPPDAEEAVRAGDHPVVLVIPEDYAEDFRAGDPATVRLVVDNSERNNDKFSRRAERLLRGYSNQMAALRLAARGVSPTAISPVVVDEVDVSTAQARAALFLGMIPYFVIVAGLMGGFYLAADTTAGERERGSLEPLLSTAATRGELVLGKLAAAVVYSGAALALTLMIYFVSFGYMPLEELGLRATLDPFASVRIFAVALPFVFLGAALMVVIASFSKTYKEAQTYLSFVTLIPIVPMLFTLFSSPKIKLWMMLVPTLSQHLLVNDLLRGEAIEPVFILASIGSTTAIGVALATFAVWLYRRERILGG
jgi:sodium transport system permease protein